MENQEPRDKSEDDQQRKQDLFDIGEHARLVESTVKTLSNIDYHLKKLKVNDEEYKNAPASLEHSKWRLKHLLNQDFQLLELTDYKNYINTFGAFYRLHKSLKEQYEREVLKTDKGPEPVTLNKI